MNTDMLTPIIVALVSATGLWTFLSSRSKLAHERAMQEREERGEFNDTLRIQVDRLAEQVNTLVREKEDLLRQMSDLRADLAAAQTTIKHLEDLLRAR